MARLLGMTRFWNYISDWIECRVHLRPEKDNALDLGSSDYQWRRVYVGPGTAGAPAITPDGDTNTGLWQSAADNLDFSTGGVNRLNISSAGVTVTGSILGTSAIGARVYNNADITIGNNSWTALTFNSERFDTDDIHSTSTNTSRLTAARTGTYLIFGSVHWADNATGRRILRILAGGTDTIARVEYAIVSSSTAMTISTVYRLLANNYVELSVYQSSGGDLNVKYYGAWSPEFGMVRLA
ncbi:MAG: hypothetical protein WC683_08675 [bacterium]